MIEAAGPAADDVRISTDPADLDVDWLCRVLAERAYWSLGRSRATVLRSIENSICFGAYVGSRQVGFARVVTDLATFGWICDVFVDEAHRQRGIGGRLVDAIVADPRIGSVSRLVLASREARDLYQRHGGFAPLAAPERWLERRSSEPEGH